MRGSATRADRQQVPEYTLSRSQQNIETAGDATSCLDLCVDGSILFVVATTTATSVSCRIGQ